MQNNASVHIYFEMIFLLNQLYIIHWVLLVELWWKLNIFLQSDLTVPIAHDIAFVLMLNGISHKFGSGMLVVSAFLIWEMDRI